MKTAFMLTRTLFLTWYKVVRTPGKLVVTAGNNNRVYDESLKKYKYIVNLRAITEANEPKIKEAFSGKQEIEIEAINGLTMTANVIENDNGRAVDLPIPGEKVTIITDWVKGRDGNMVLAVIKMNVAKAVEAEAFKFDDEDTTISAEEKEIQSLSATGQTATSVAEIKKETAKVDSF